MYLYLLYLNGYIVVTVFYILNSLYAHYEKIVLSAYDVEECQKLIKRCEYDYYSGNSCYIK